LIALKDEPGIYSLRRTSPDENGNIFVNHEINHAAWSNPAPIRNGSYHRTSITRPGFGGHHSSVQPIYEDSDQDEGVEDLNSVSDRENFEVE